MDCCERFSCPDSTHNQPAGTQEAEVLTVAHLAPSTARRKHEKQSSRFLTWKTCPCEEQLDCTLGKQCLPLQFFHLRYTFYTTTVFLVQIILMHSMCVLKALDSTRISLEVFIPQTPSCSECCVPHILF